MYPYWRSGITFEGSTYFKCPLMRKAFKFYRSYYDVMIELPEKDQLPFLKALLEKQFFGTEPKLKGMAKFAYISQKHSIEAQVLGYEKKTGDLIKNPSDIPPIEGGSTPPLAQEEVEEKEEVEGEVKPDPHPLQLWIKENLKTVSQLRDQITFGECEKIIEAYGKNLVWQKLEAMENKKTLLKDYTSVYLTLNNWCRIAKQDEKKNQKLDKETIGIMKALGKTA